MTGNDLEVRWERLLTLLDPFHAEALATARRLCRSVDDGDDLYQEALRRAFLKLADLRDPHRFRAWFFAVLLSVHRSRSRRAFWKRFVSWEAIHSGESPGFDPPGEDGRREEETRRGAERAAEALAALPAVQREAIVLFDLEGLALHEVARLQKASLSAVKTRLGRGRERLRVHYRKRGWAPEDPATVRSRDRSTGDPREDPAASALLGAAPLLARREKQP